MQVKWDNAPSDAEHRRWESQSHRERCQRFRSVAAELIGRTQALCRLASSPRRTDDVETLTAEILPLAAALKWISKHGGRVLAERRLGVLGRPPWLWGVRHRVCRVPRGRVLVIGTWNYPIFLSGSQIATSLAAGNQTWIKPAPGAEAVTREVAQAFWAAGIPETTLRVLGSDIESAKRRIADGVELVVLTGSAQTGRQVMRMCAESLTPSIIEAGGCDAMIGLPSADPKRFAKLLNSGLQLNSGATCIGPRRVLIPRQHRDEFKRAIADTFDASQTHSVHPAAHHSTVDAIQLAMQAGARTLTGETDDQRLKRDGVMRPTLLENVDAKMDVANRDIFAPLASVIEYTSEDELVSIVNDCRYGLAASLVGEKKHAMAIAKRIDVGAVTINDLVVPTADPRLPFGGRGESGHGVTRGADGLLAMTRVQTISTRHGKWLPHLQARRPGDFEMLARVGRMLYGKGKPKRS